MKITAATGASAAGAASWAGAGVSTALTSSAGAAAVSAADIIAGVRGMCWGGNSESATTKGKREER
jgi:hypothetical protein